MTESDRYRNFIDKLYELLVSKSSMEVSEKPVTENPCFCRYEHNGLLWCAKSAPRTVEITTLKICKACLKRITKETSEVQALKTHYYTLCGAREHHDKKKGQMLYCSKHFQGQWVTPQDCKTAKCLDLKEVKTT